MKNVTWPLGLISGILLLVGSLGPVIGTDGSAGEVQGASLGYLMVLLAAIGAIVAMVIVARKNAEVRFIQLIKTGLLTALITTLVYYVGSVIFYKWVSPDFLANLREAHIQKKALTILDVAKRTEYVQSAEADKSKYVNAFTYSAIQSIIVFMMCLMPVAICGYVLFRLRGRKKLAE